MMDIIKILPISAIVLSLAASLCALFNSRKTAVCLSVGSVVVLMGYLGALWCAYGNPPLKTMGHTRLWYSFFAVISGLMTYLRWKYKWILSFSTLLATVFILLSLKEPVGVGESLPPALQSAWFIPHVTVYMFSYSLLGCAFLIGVVGLFKKTEDLLRSADTLVYIGVAFLTFGMLSGAIWAKSAWGHFWSWDPKETWALLTWLLYMLYIHLRIYSKGSVRVLCILLIFAFACLQMCWWGINFLPSAADSVHVY